MLHTWTIFQTFVFVVVGIKYDFFTTCTNFITFSLIMYIYPQRSLRYKYPINMSGFTEVF
jgi:hypothetical protein